MLAEISSRRAGNDNFLVRGSFDCDVCVTLAYARQQLAYGGREQLGSRRVYQFGICAQRNSKRGPPRAPTTCANALLRS